MQSDTKLAAIAAAPGSILADAPVYSSFATPALRTLLANGVLTTTTVSIVGDLSVSAFDGTHVEAGTGMLLTAPSGTYAPRVMTIAFSNTVGGWSTTDSVLITAKNYRNELVTYAVKPSTANGNETKIVGLVKQVLRVEIPKQPLAGTILLGVDAGSHVPMTREVLFMAAGVVEFMFADDDYYTQLTIPAGMVGLSKNWSVKAIGPAHAASTRLFR